MSDRTEAFADLLTALVELAPTKRLREIVQTTVDQIEQEAAPTEHDPDLRFPPDLTRWRKAPHVDVHLCLSCDETSEDDDVNEPDVPMTFSTILSGTEVEWLVRHMRKEQKNDPEYVWVEFTGHANVYLIRGDDHCTVTHRLDADLQNLAPCKQPRCGKCDRSEAASTGGAQ